MKMRLPEFDPEIAPADSKQFSPTGTNLKKRFPIRNATAWLRLRTTRAMRLLPLLLLLALPAVVLAQYPYTTHNGAATIAGYSGPGGEVTIPSTLDGLPVPVILGSMPGTWLSALAANDPLVTVDASFNPGAGGNVYCLAIQADGKVLVGGGFFGRLNVDGTIDSSFNPRANSPVTCLAIQPDGKIIVGGNFTSLDGQSRTNIGRLNADGTVDNTFNSGANGTIFCLAVQPDGQIVVGGTFSSLGGQLHQNLGRLNANGTVDSTFNPESSDAVFCLAIQADGKMLVGGNFSTLGGQLRQCLGRLNGKRGQPIV